MEVLDNLVRIHQLKTEPADAAEFADNKIGIKRGGQEFWDGY